MAPRLFIGCSAEQIDVARAVQEALDEATEVTVWDDGVFGLSQYTLESLLQTLEDVDFGLFVFAPDDVTIMRGKNVASVRDNVLFELGLFVGRLGRHCTFIMHPRRAELHLPTDLLGLTTADYESERSDNDMLRAVQPACRKITRAMHRAVALREDVVEPCHAAGTGLETATQDWDFGNIYKADERLARCLGRWRRIGTCRMVAYTNKILLRTLERLRGEGCKIDELRVLVRDPRRLLAELGQVGAIPNDEAKAADRVHQFHTSVLRDLVERKFKKSLVRDFAGPRFYHGQPVLRGVVLEGAPEDEERRVGYLSIYGPNPDDDQVDWHGSTSAALRLSQDGGYEEKLLNDFVEWFDQVWDPGSTDIDTDELRSIVG